MWVAACALALCAACSNKKGAPNATDGTNGNSPVVTAMQDTSVAVYDSFSVHASGTSSDGTLSNYVWALDGTSFRDSTEDGTIRTAMRWPGARTVLVKVLDNDGLESAADSITITVHEYPPCVSAMHDTSVALNDTFYIHAAGSDTNGTIRKYLWAFNGTNYKDSTDSGIVKTVFSAAGENTVLVKVRDDDGVYSGSGDTLVVTVHRYAPKVLAMQDTNVAANDSFFIHATGSDTNGTITKYLWALDGTNYADVTNSGTLKTAFTSAGVKAVLVKAFDNDDIVSENTDTVRITVHLYAPAVFAMQDTSVAVFDSFYVHAAGTDSFGTITKYFWAFDGYTYNDSADAGTVKTSFAGAGVKTVLVKARDNMGHYSVNPDTVKITVHSYAPRVTAMPDTDVAQSDSFSIHATAADTNGTITKYLWALDGVVYRDSSDIGICKASFPTTGIKNVIVKVRDDDGLFSSPDTVKVTVRSNAPINSSPANGALNTSYRPALAWVPGYYSAGFTVLLDTLNPPVSVAASGITANSFTTATALLAGKTYYWQIIGLNASAQEAPGEIWHFTTMSAAAGWSAVGTGTSTIVNAVKTDLSGNLYAGGYFSTAGGATASNIAKWNGSTWSALGGGVAGGAYLGVAAIAMDNSGNLYAGGDFITAGGISAGHVAKWNGSAWSTLGSGTNNEVYALACDASGNLYAGGNFTTAGGTTVNYVAKWNGVSWSALGSGLVSSTLLGVNALALDGSGNLYVGGDFSNAGGVPASCIAKWNGISWSALGSGTNQPVWSLSIDASGNLYAGGEFTTAGGTTANHIAKWNGATWSAVGTGMNTGSGFGGITALAIDGSGSLYAGGDFTTAGGLSALHAARWNGTAWSALGSGTSGQIWALAAGSSGVLYAGGEFTLAGGATANHIAQWK
jgi:hypothetical protein